METTDQQQEVPYKHQPTPINNPSKPTHRKPPPAPSGDRPNSDDLSVSCNKCRPNSRDKISVIPIDVNNSDATKKSSSSSSSTNPSPNGIFRSLISSLTRKSPKSSESSSSSFSSTEEQWKLAVAELSHKLMQASRRRDEALLEASRLKHSVSELEKKLNKLEIYCNNLKSGLEVCSGNSPNPLINPTPFYHHHDQDIIIVQSFLNAVADARAAVRMLGRSLTLQLRQMAGGGKVYDRISSLLQPYDVNGSVLKNPRSLSFYLEAVLNRAFHEDFETGRFLKNGSDRILNPIEKCEANYAAFTVLQGLTWDQVLNKGTRHFSGEFSGFCDRKMSEIVAMLGWNRAWPEPLLQAFFAAAKTVWLVHLLACSVHPRLPIFRVDQGVRFDVVYMEDMGGDKAGQKLVPDTVRVMVAPGFYVYSNVVKCKVLCRYYSNGRSTTNQGSPPTTTTTIGAALLSN